GRQATPTEKRHGHRLGRRRRRPGSDRRDREGRDRARPQPPGNRPRARGVRGVWRSHSPSAPQRRARSASVHHLPGGPRRGRGRRKLQPARQQGQPTALTPWACCARLLAMTTEAGVAGGNSWWRALADLFARLRGAGPRDPTGLRLRPARVRERDGYVSLHFIRGQTQSRMRSDAPEHLLIDYTRTMLAALLWRPKARRIGIVGLGGGSQVKF